MNLISLLNHAFKEPGDTPAALVATTSIANTCRCGTRRKNCSEGRKEGRKTVKEKVERTIARAVDGGRLAGQNGRKSPVLPKPRGENTITPLPGGRHNEFIAGNLRTINAELLTYCFASSWVAFENGRRGGVDYFPFPDEAAPLLRAIYCSQVLGGKVGNGRRDGEGRRRVFYRGASYYGANRAPFARQASTGVVIYRTFLAFLVYEAH